MAWDNISSWLPAVINGGLQVGQQLNTNNTQGNYADMLRSSEQQNYDNQKQAYDAYVANTQNAWAASNARSSAARQTEKNRQAALKKAMDTEKKYYAQSQKLFQPWVDTGAQLLPKAAETYGNSLSGMNGLMALLQSPEMMKKMNASTPAYSVGLKIPDYLKGA